MCTENKKPDFIGQIPDELLLISFADPPKDLYFSADEGNPLYFSKLDLEHDFLFI